MQDESFDRTPSADHRVECNCWDDSSITPHSEAGSSGSRNRGVDNPRLNEVYMERSSLTKEVGVYCLSNVYACMRLIRCLTSFKYVRICWPI